GIAVVNHHLEPLRAVTARAAVYDLSGRKIQDRQARLDAAPNACTNLFALVWPPTGAYLAKLTLEDHKGHLLSQNFYWHARDPEQLQNLNSMEKVGLAGRMRPPARGRQTATECEISNSSRSPALAIKLTLRNAETGQRILPVYYDDNYFSLLPGESRVIQIESGSTARPQITVEGWNVMPLTIRPTTL
ncbi:MAG: glycoside hydrolase family 2 protein, partial [Verrucomicrobiota bacterium]